MPIFKLAESISAQSYPVYNEKNGLINTAKVDRTQLPTEKLFCRRVMFFGRDENLTFTQLEQREWLRFTEILTSDGFVRIFYPLCRSSKTIHDEFKSCMYLMYILCAMYFINHFELYRSHSHHFIQCVWGIPILPFRF